MLAHIAHHLWILIGILYAICALLLPLLIYFTGNYFDQWLKDYPYLTVYKQPLSKLQRSVQYAFCIFDMGDRHYKERKMIYLGFDLVKKARKIDVILSSFFVAAGYMAIGTTLMILLNYIIGILVSVAVICWYEELKIWFH